MTETETIVAIAPHNFVPIRRWDQRRSGRCELCHCPAWLHPTTTWVERRIADDTCPASVTGDERHTHIPNRVRNRTILAWGFVALVLVLWFIQVVATVG